MVCPLDCGLRVSSNPVGKARVTTQKMTTVATVGSAVVWLELAVQQLQEVHLPPSALKRSNDLYLRS